MRHDQSHSWLFRLLRLKSCALQMIWLTYLLLVPCRPYTKNQRKAPQCPYTSYICKLGSTSRWLDEFIDFDVTLAISPYHTRDQHAYYFRLEFLSCIGAQRGAGVLVSDIQDLLSGVSQDVTKLAVIFIKQLLICLYFRSNRAFSVAALSLSGTFHVPANIRLRQSLLL